MVSEISSFAITGYINTKAPPEVAGVIGTFWYWYEGLSEWAPFTECLNLPINTALHLAPSWLNQSAEPLSGHVGLTITKPDGSEVTPADVLNQNNWATPGNGYGVQFEPITLDQVGQYQAKVTLSTMGQTLDEKTYAIANAQLPVAAGEILEILWRATDSEVWHPISEPMPWEEPYMGEEYYLGFTVKNTGSTAPFKVGIWTYDAFAGWHWLKSRSFDIEAGSEGLIEWPLWFGRTGDEDITFHLFSDDTEVDSMTVRVTVR